MAEIRYFGRNRLFRRKIVFRPKHRKGRKPKCRNRNRPKFSAETEPKLFRFDHYNQGQQYETAILKSIGVWRDAPLNCSSYRSTVCRTSPSARWSRPRSRGRPCALPGSAASSALVGTGGCSTVPFQISICVLAVQFAN